MKKFIISDNHLILGNVNYHDELKKGDHKGTIGGGRWVIHEDVLYLWGKSDRFGCVTTDDVKKANKRSTYNDIKIVFGETISFQDTLEIGTIIQESTND